MASAAELFADAAFAQFLLRVAACPFCARSPPE
jgi:hypothetical protein